MGIAGKNVSVVPKFGTGYQKIAYHKVWKKKSTAHDPFLKRPDVPPIDLRGCQAPLQ